MLPIKEGQRNKMPFPQSIPFVIAVQLFCVGAQKISLLSYFEIKKKTLSQAGICGVKGKFELSSWGKKEGVEVMPTI